MNLKAPIVLLSGGLVWYHSNMGAKSRSRSPRSAGGRNSDRSSHHRRRGDRRRSGQRKRSSPDSRERRRRGRTRTRRGRSHDKGKARARRGKSSSSSKDTRTRDRKQARQSKSRSRSEHQKRSGRSSCSGHRDSPAAHAVPASRPQERNPLPQLAQFSLGF